MQSDFTETMSGVLGACTVNIICRHLLMSNSQKVAILFMPVLIDDLPI